MRTDTIFEGNKLKSTIHTSKHGESMFTIIHDDDFNRFKIIHKTNPEELQQALARYFMALEIGLRDEEQ